MNAHARIRLSEADYLAWELRQGQKHELVDGEVRAMAGAQAGHNRVALNILVALKLHLRGKPCEPFGSDMKVRIPNGNFRYPDAVVDCGRPANDAMFAADPRVVMEVLSPSTGFFDQADKLAEYQSIPGVAHVVLFAADRAFARVWTRAGDGFLQTDVSGDDGAFALPAIETTFALADAYEGVTFAQEPLL